MSKLLANQQIFGSVFSDKTSFAYRATSSFVTGLASAALGGGRTTVAQIALEASGSNLPVHPIKVQVHEGEVSSITMHKLGHMHYQYMRSPQNSEKIVR